MSINTTYEESNDKPEATDEVNVKRLIVFFVLITVVLPAVILFGSTGRLDWWMAWAFIAFMGGGTIISRLLVMRKHPDLLAERAKSLGNKEAKSWDRVLVPLIVIFGPLVTLVVAGLDMRYGWSPEFLPALPVVALVVLALSYLIGHWAMMANRFFSGTVRIQKDRGHTVVSSGPYRYVRHPGYTGAVITYLATPVILGSLWAFIPTVLSIGVLIFRTALEDRTLQRELPGYAEYAQQTRYRLLPGVW